jgi:hypothetical protein
MHAIAAGAGIVVFPEGLKDNGQPVNWLHLTVASILMGLTAYGLSAFIHLL